MFLTTNIYFFRFSFLCCARLGEEEGAAVDGVADNEVRTSSGMFLDKLPGTASAFSKLPDF
jgi:hypothetical protein